MSGEASAPIPSEPTRPSGPRLPKYDWGVRVTATIDLYNDGSYPEVEEDALLVPSGTPGDIVRVGHAEESDVPVYLVEFPGGVMIGCLEEEIAPVLGERRAAPGRM